MLSDSDDTARLMGRISLNQFMPGIVASQNSKIVALVSGHRDKAEKLVRELATARREC